MKKKGGVGGSLNLTHFVKSEKQVLVSALKSLPFQTYRSITCRAPARKEGMKVLGGLDYRIGKFCAQNLHQPLQIGRNSSKGVFLLPAIATIIR